jgi:hypothetical protein
VSSTALRPLGVGEILDVSIKAYSTNARTLITIGAIVGIPFELLNGLIQISTVSSSNQVGGSLVFHTGSTTVDYSRARVAGLVVTFVLGAVVTLVITAAMVKAISDAYLGGRPTVRDSLRFGARRVASLFWMYLLLGVGLTVALIAVVLPAIWLYVAWSVATPVLLVEGLRGSAALRRSFRLVRGRWWTVAFTLLIARLMVSIASGLVVAVFLVVPHVIDNSSVLLAVIGATIASCVATALVQPLQSAIVTVLYFDLRVRRDGFDLELLAAGVGLPAVGTLPANALAPTVSPPAPALGEPGGSAPPSWPLPPGWESGAPEAGADGGPSPPPSSTGWPSGWSRE